MPTNEPQIKEPIRMYRESDPYYYEVDNLPLEDLLENCGRLQLQINDLPDFSIYATVGNLESKYVKIADYNARRLSGLDEDVSTNIAPQDDDMFMFQGIYHTVGSPDLGGRWKPITMTSRTDLFPQYLKHLHDVDPDLAPGDGQVLKYIANEWTAADDIEFPNLNDLGDVVISSPVRLDDILFYKSGKWRNGWPDILPEFMNVGSEDDGDILRYNSSNSKYDNVSPTTLPHRTIMFKDGGVELYGGSQIADLQGLDVITWNSAFKSIPSGYQDTVQVIDNAVQMDGTAYKINDFHATAYQPTHAYIMGVTQFTRAADMLGGFIEVAIYDEPTGVIRSTAYHHANTNSVRSNQNNTEDVVHTQSFSGWVPIYWNPDGNARICVDTWATQTVPYVPKTPIMHIRVLGVRT